MDARDSVEGTEDSIGSARPPRPPKPPREPERTKVLLLRVIAVAAVATAVLSGVNAWETHQDRSQTRDLYCASYPEPDEDADDDEMQFYDDSFAEIRDVLDC